MEDIILDRIKILKLERIRAIKNHNTTRHNKVPNFFKNLSTGKLHLILRRLMM